MTIVHQITDIGKVEATNPLLRFFYDDELEVGPRAYQEPPKLHPADRAIFEVDSIVLNGIPYGRSSMTFCRLDGLDVWEYGYHQGRPNVWLAASTGYRKDGGICVNMTQAARDKWQAISTAIAHAELAKVGDRLSARARVEWAREKLAAHHKKVGDMERELTALKKQTPAVTKVYNDMLSRERAMLKRKAK